MEGVSSVKCEVSRDEVPEADRLGLQTGHFKAPRANSAKQSQFKKEGMWCTPYRRRDRAKQTQSKKRLTASLRTGWPTRRACQGNCAKRSQVPPLCRSGDRRSQGPLAPNKPNSVEAERKTKYLGEQELWQIRLAQDRAKTKPISAVWATTGPGRPSGGACPWLGSDMRDKPNSLSAGWNRRGAGASAVAAQRSRCASNKANSEKPDRRSEGQSRKTNSIRSGWTARTARADCTNKPNRQAAAGAGRLDYRGTNKANSVKAPLGARWGRQPGGVPPSYDRGADLAAYAI